MEQDYPQHWARCRTVGDGLFLAGAPSFQVLDDGITPAPGDDPGHFLVTVVDFLMLGVGWDESEISRSQLLPLLPTFGDDGAMACGCIDDRVLFTVMVDS